MNFSIFVNERTIELARENLEKTNEGRVRKFKSKTIISIHYHFNLSDVAKRKNDEIQLNLQGFF